MSEDNTAPEGQTNTTAENVEAVAQTQINNEAVEPAEPTGNEGEIPEGETTEKKEKRPGWIQKRLNELTYEKKQALHEAESSKKQVETLIAELAAAKSGTKDHNGTNTLPITEIDRLATEKAKDIASKQVSEARYVESIDHIWNTGLKEFPDFGDAVDNLNGAFGEKFSNILPVFTEALDNPHKVMHHLGDNLDEAARILSLSPAKQIAELTKLEAALATKAKPISKVSAPIKTVDSGKGKADPSLDSDKLSTAEWMKLRTKDLEKKGKRLF